MDEQLFLRNLRDLSLEEGKAYIQQHIAELEDYVGTCNVIAEEALHQRDMDPFVALKLADILIFLGEYTQNIYPHALGCKAKGDILNSVGHVQAAIESLDIAAEEFLRLGDKINWARSRVTWIIACAWTGRVEEALEGAILAKETFLQHGERYWACVVDHNMAVVYSQIGDYQKALDLYDQMLTIYPTLTDQNETFIKRAVAMAEVNQARNLAWLGNFEQAQHLMRKAQESFIELGQVGFIIVTEANLADFDYAQGYYGSALRRYYQVRDSFIQHKFDAPPFLAATMIQIATCLVKLKRVDEACAIAAESVQSVRQIGVSLTVGDVLREYATTLVASGRVKEAFAALDEAWHVFHTGGFHHHAFTTKLQQAELLLEMGEVTSAYKEAKALKEYFDAQGLVSRALSANLVMIRALMRAAQQIQMLQAGVQPALLLREATLLCKETAVQARHHLQEPAYMAQHVLGQLAALEGNLHKAARHYGVAIARIEHILDDLAYDLGTAFLRTAWTVYEDMIALRLRQNQPELAFSYLERARSMALRQYLDKTKANQSQKEEPRESGIVSSPLQTNNAVLLRLQYDLRFWQEKYHDYCTMLSATNSTLTSVADKEAASNELRRYEAKINELFERLQLHEFHASPDFRLALSEKRRRRKQHVHAVDVAHLRQALVADQLLLAYFLYNERIVIFALTKERLVTYEIPDGVAQVERLLPALYVHLQPDAWPAPNKPPQLTIRRLLHKLYTLLLAPIADLFPSSSGLITVVPYGQLHKLPFHALYNGSRFLIEDFQIQYLPASSMIEFFHAQDSEQSNTPSKSPLLLGYSEHGQLQFALEEAKRLSDMVDGRCYLDSEATIARLIAEAPGSPFIHIATHGQNKLDAPNFSFVRLADGQLNAIDAFSLDLRTCELVTLSGCETGLAMSGGGDEQLGLGRAFLAAGADSLVMSLWTVEDKVTNELMQLFYQRLLQGDTKVQALRAAQCSLLRQTDSVTSHPYFWAAFRLVGDVSPLRFKVRPQMSTSLAFE